MSSSFHVPRPSISRRTLLRGMGVSMALPFLEAMRPLFGSAARAADAESAVPRRLVAIETNQGILPQKFFPEQSGRDYELSPYLKVLEAHRNDLTVFSGVSHPDVDGGHEAEICFLSGAPHPLSGGFRNTISLDQFAAEQIGTKTRFPSLSVLIGPGSRGLSYTRNGVMIPPESSPAAIYRRMFIQGNPQEVAARLEDLRRGRSLLDFVSDRARQMQDTLGGADRQRVDEYFTAVRGLERQFQESAAWEQRPKPKAAVPEPQEINLKDHSLLIDKIQQMYDVLRLAVESDSTRLITVFVSFTTPPLRLPGVSQDTHNLTHHGGSTEALSQLETIEKAGLAKFAGLLDGLKSRREQDATLLDRTMMLFGTCMGDANTHSNVNLPVLLAGGGFRHGQHLAFDRNRNYPLANLFVSMLQRLGVETDRFASSTGNMRGLELS